MHKSHPAFDEWAQRTVISRHGPAQVTIHSTNRCNLKCFFCWHGVVDEIPEAIIPERLDPYFEKAERLLFSGGEPLWLTKNVNRLGGEIFDRILHHHPHLKINTLTNGVLLGKRKAEMVIKHFEGVCFSLHTPDPDVYQKIYGKRLLDTVLANIENLNAMKKQAGLGRYDMPLISMNSVVMDSTLEDIPLLTKKLWDLGGIHHIVSDLQDSLSQEFYYLNTADYLSQEKQPEAARQITSDCQYEIQKEFIRPGHIPNERLERVREKMRISLAETGLELIDKSRFFRQWEVPSPSRVDSVCPYPWIRAYIFQNGDVSCCETNSNVLGNINDQDFEEIWNGAAAREMRVCFMKGEKKGCIRDACNLPVNSFDVTAAYVDVMLSRLDCQGEVKSIVLLRSAPLLQSYLTAQALKRKFPRAHLTVVTNSDGIRDGVSWGSNTEVLVHPGKTIEPESFMPWFTNHSNGMEYSLAVMSYSNKDKKGYERVERVLDSIKAKNRIGIIEDGRSVRL